MKGTGRHRWVWPLAAALAGMVMLLRAASTIWVFNDTRDEPFHIASAISLFEHGRLVHGVETPPISRLVQGSVLRLAGAVSPLEEQRKGAIIRESNAAFSVGNDILSHGAIPYWRTLTAARLATLAFAVISLVYVYLLGRWCAGPAVGALSVVFFSTDPTFLAHSALATADAAACAGFLIGTYHALRWLYLPPDWVRAISAGIAIGVAIASKFSCLILLPVVALLLVCRCFLSSSRRPQRALRHAFSGALAAGGVMLLTLWACYGFDVGQISESEIISRGTWNRTLPKFVTRLDMPMPSFTLGLLTMVSHNRHEQASYLNGEVRAEDQPASWRYFPEALVVKSPSGLLIGMLLAIALALRRARRQSLSIAIAVTGFMFLALAITSSVQIGVRHVLPVIPLLYVLVSLQLARRGWVIVLGLLIAWAFVETAVKHPDYLSFFNVAASRGYKGKPLLLDSNLDWGQDIARLSRWLQSEHPNTPYETRIFGNANVTLQPGTPLQFNQLRYLSKGLFIISKNVKYGLYPLKDPLDPKGSRSIPVPDFVLHTTPTHRLGDSIEVYDIAGSASER